MTRRINRVHFESCFIRIAQSDHVISHAKSRALNHSLFHHFPGDCLFPCSAGLVHHFCQQGPVLTCGRRWEMLKETKDTAPNVEAVDVDSYDSWLLDLARSLKKKKCEDLWFLRRERERERSTRTYKYVYICCLFDTYVDLAEWVFPLSFTKVFFWERDVVADSYLQKTSVLPNECEFAGVFLDNPIQKLMLGLSMIAFQ